MASFSPTQVALTGFGVMRKHPRAVLIWTMLITAFQLVAHYLYLSYLINIQAHKAADSPLESGVLSALGPYAPYFGFVMAVGLPFVIVQSVFYNGMVSATINRVVLRPNESALSFLRFGADEFRQIGLSLLFATLLGAGSVMATAMSFSISARSGAGLAVVGGLLALLIVAVVGIYLAVRLSLASALISDRRVFDVFGSWSLTRGRVLPILGAYALAVSVSFAIQSFGSAVIFGVVASIGGGSYNPILVFTDPHSTASNFTPAHVVQTVLTAALTAVTSPIIYTVSPAIYQALTKPEY